MLLSFLLKKKKRKTEPLVIIGSTEILKPQNTKNCSVYNNTIFQIALTHPWKIEQIGSIGEVEIKRGWLLEEEGHSSYEGGLAQQGSHNYSQVPTDSQVLDPRSRDPSNNMSDSKKYSTAYNMPF